MKEGGTFYRQTYGLSASFYCVWAVLVSPLFFILFVLGPKYFTDMPLSYHSSLLKKVRPLMGNRFIFCHMPFCLLKYASCLVAFFLVPPRFLSDSGSVASSLFISCLLVSGFCCFYRFLHCFSFFRVCALAFIGSWNSDHTPFDSKSVWNTLSINVATTFCASGVTYKLFSYRDWYVSNCLYFYLFFSSFYSVFNM